MSETREGTLYVELPMISGPRWLLLPLRLVWRRVVRGSGMVIFELLAENTIRSHSLIRQFDESMADDGLELAKRLARGEITVQEFIEMPL